MLPRRAEAEPVNIIGVDGTRAAANAAAAALGLFYDEWSGSVDALVRGFIVDDDVADAVIESVFWRAWQDGVADLASSQAVASSLRTGAARAIAKAIKINPSTRRIFTIGALSGSQSSFRSEPAGSVITSELASRTRRPPDGLSEAKALRRIATLLTGDPQILLDALVSIAVELCGGTADGTTAGVSLLEAGPEDAQQFRWVAMAGRLASHIGGTTPRDNSPCGVCLDEDRPVLFSRPDLRFTYFQATGVTFVEGLVIPFYSDDGKTAIGTIWIVSHDAGRQFDAEDVRIMTSLAGFTGAGFQLMSARDSSERARKQLEIAWFEADRARAAAEAANRSKSQFLATMSHELRTPLNAVAGYAELLKIGVHGPTTEAQNDALSRIQRSTRHVERLVNEVLNFAKLDGGAISFTFDEIALDDLFGRVEEMISPQLRAKNLEYRFLGPAAPSPSIRTDGEKLVQILVNLLSNAVKFTQSPGTITCSYELGESEAQKLDPDVLNLWADRPDGAPRVIRIHVKDSGCGIPEDGIESIFDPFVQVNQGLDSSSEGIGLGLAISRSLARGIGGDLTAQSYPGVGSTFTVTLPLGAT